MVVLESFQLFSLGIILVGVLLFSLVERKLGFPPLLGAVFIGIILGQSGINFITYDQLPEWLSFFSLIGGMLILFVVGMETNIRDLVTTSKKSLSITALGIFFPAIFVLIAGTLFHFGIKQTALLVAAATMTATPTSLALLIALKKTHTRAAQYLHASTIMDNIIGIFFILLLIAVHESGTVDFYELAKLTALLIFLIGISYTVMPKVSKYIFNRFGHPSPESRITIAFALILFLGAVTSQFLFEAAFGAFLAGIMMSEIKEEYKKQLLKTFREIGEGLFFPLFFLTIGLAVNVESVLFSVTLLAFVTAYIAIAILGKFAGGYYGALLSNLNRKEAVAIGSGLIPRGGIGLIAAQIGLSLHIFTPEQFSAVVLMVFFTTVIGFYFIYKTFSQLK